jgi:hypothetical protein
MAESLVDQRLVTRCRHRDWNIVNNLSLGIGVAVGVVLYLRSPSALADFAFAQQRRFSELSVPGSATAKSLFDSQSLDGV